jgi:hypothetical protein
VLAEAGAAVPAQLMLIPDVTVVNVALPPTGAGNQGRHPPVGGGPRRAGITKPSRLRILPDLQTQDRCIAMVTDLTTTALTPAITGNAADNGLARGGRDPAGIRERSYTPRRLLGGAKT